MRPIRARPSSTWTWQSTRLHQESYLRTVFGFLGITDVRIVRAEGLALGDDMRTKAMAQAHAAIIAHTAEAANQPRSALRA